jgi:hypothetical protein
MRFRNLSEEETSEFRQWARDNWTVGEDIDPLWHPVVRAMCERMENDLQTRLDRDV